MHIEFYNTPPPDVFDPSLVNQSIPAFVTYSPKIQILESVIQKQSAYKNILIIANGGSITSFYGFYNLLKKQATKKAYFLSTVDPDYIYKLRQKLAPHDTLVVAISKSGETVTQIEALNQFLDYPVLIITGAGSSLHQIAAKLGATVIPHPPIGGRYTAFTEVALVPAMLCGLPAEKLLLGANRAYAEYEKSNLAWKAASVMWQLEQKGYNDVFMPFYSHSLYATSPLIVQLCHESFGKNEKGQTYIAAEAPESQHHTNQRFFGGPKNICGLFISTANFNHPTPNNFPITLQSIPLREHPLASMNHVPLEAAMRAELHGTLEDAKNHNIPVVHIEVTSFDPAEIGYFTAFWQLFAVYSSMLRGVDPFNQPQVETAKKISFEERLKYTGIL